MKIKKIIVTVLLLSLTCLFSACSNTANGINQDIKANTKAVKKEVNEH